MIDSNQSKSRANCSGEIAVQPDGSNISLGYVGAVENKSSIER